MEGTASGRVHARVGAAVGGAAFIYWDQATLAGCARLGAEGIQLVDERTHPTCSLVTGGDSLEPRERVQVQGKKVKDDSGAQGFRVDKIAKVFGSCEGEATGITAGGASVKRGRHARL